MKVLIPWLMVVSLLAAPTAMAQLDDASSLVGTQWQLVSYGTPGAETPVILNSSITLEFGAIQIAGHGGCNGYSGSYTVEGSTITIRQIISTMMACADNNVTQQEQTYFEALQSAVRFEIAGSQLTIWYDGEQALNFVRLNALDNLVVPSNPGSSANNELIQQEPFEDLDSPVGLLASYYNAINLRDYQRAYAYWEAPPHSYDDFVAGFADTSSAQVIVEPPTRYDGAAGSLYAAIPTVLIAQHTDGTQLTFAGCIVTRKSNLSPPDIPEEDVWHLYSADIIQVPNDSAIPGLLSQACQG